MYAVPIDILIWVFIYAGSLDWDVGAVNCPNCARKLGDLKKFLFELACLLGKCDGVLKATENSVGHSPYYSAYCAPADPNQERNFTLICPSSEEIERQRNLNERREIGQNFAQTK